MCHLSHRNTSHHNERTTRRSRPQHEQHTNKGWRCDLMPFWASGTPVGLGRTSTVHGCSTTVERLWMAQQATARTRRATSPRKENAHSEPHIMVMEHLVARTTHRTSVHDFPTAVQERLRCNRRFACSELNDPSSQEKDLHAESSQQQATIEYKEDWLWQADCKDPHSGRVAAKMRRGT